jgi:hypothetical protein
MISLDLPWWAALAKPSNLKFIYAVALGVFAAVSTWIMGIRMRRRIKRDLGRAAKESDLTSIETWMKVDEVEENKNPGRAWVPKSSAADKKTTRRDL